MKLKTSFCNATVLKKDITRFLPVWVIYLICGLLTASTMVGNHIGSVASTIRGVLSYGMPWISCGYALMVALLLFGDLYNSCLCNALHAMPLRRESWFCSHYLSGLLMALVPNLLISLVLMPMLGSLWYIALIWVGGSMLMYLFFFGLASLCCMATGNRFAAILVYALVNFFSMELYWLFSELILPFLDGVRLQTIPAVRFCPVIQLMDGLYFTFERLSESYYANNYAFVGFASGWPYLFIVGAIGVALGAGALLLYRRRQLEVAGDFAAVAPVKWLISIFGSLACGMVFRLFGWSNKALGYAFLFIGIVIGFFLLQMLLQRKVKIFSKASFIKCTALVLCCAMILIAGAVDLLGIKTYVPRESQVQSVLIAPRYLYEEELRSTEPSSIDGLFFEDPTDIGIVLDIHRLALQEYSRQDPYGDHSYITIRYTLKSGRSVSRSYWVSTSSSAFQKLSILLQRQAYIFCNCTPQQIKDGLQECYFNGQYMAKSTTRQLIDYLYRDAGKGKVSRLLTEDSNQEDFGYVELNWRPNNISWRSVDLYLHPDSESLAFLRSHMDDAQQIFDVSDLQEFVDNLEAVALHTPGLGSNESYTLSKDDAVTLANRLWLDVQDGNLSPTDTFTTDCLYVTVNVRSPQGTTICHFEVSSRAANTWVFLEEYLLQQDLWDMYERMMERG